MNPSQVSKQDWPLYYNHSFMHHRDRGIVEVSTVDRRIYARNLDTTWTVVRDVAKLECIHPRGRTMNVGKSAVYIGRRATREARRSALRSSYYAHWRPPATGFTLNVKFMHQLCNEEEYPNLVEALRRLKLKTQLAVAITKDLIVLKRQKEYGLNCCGSECGTVTFVNGRLAVEPTLGDKNPAYIRALYKLEKEGLLCH
jgi:hypothetical protein